MTTEVAQFLEQLKRDIPVIAELKPLRVGVRHDIVARYSDVPLKVVNKALAMHCGTPTYLRRCTPGACRFGLDGKRDGEVNETHAQAAAERLEKVRARRKEPPKPPGRRPVLSLKRPRVAAGGPGV